MKSKFEYVRAESKQQALEFLASHGQETSVLAGGTDLLIAIRKGEITSRYVLDVSRVEEMRSVERSNGSLVIGSATTFTELAHAPLVLTYAPVLASAVRHVGSLQIRNAGTIGGNVVNASPAADGVPPLVVHRCQVLVESAESQEVVPLDRFITGPYVTALRPDQLVTQLELEPLNGDYRSTFHRIARRRALAIARMNVAVVARMRSSGEVDDIRISVGSVTPAPCRMIAAESCLTNRRPVGDLIGEAATKVSQEMVKLSGIRPTTEYKKPAVEGLVTKALTELLLDGSQ